jgi:hypothetical protein
MLTGNNLSKTPCFWFVKPFFYFVLTSDLFFMPAESQALMRGNYTDPAATHYWVSRNLSMHWWKYWNARKVLPWEEAWLNSIIYRRTVFDCNLTHINAVMTFLLSSFSFNFNWVSSKSILSSLYQSLLFRAFAIQCNMVFHENLIFLIKFFFLFLNFFCCVNLKNIMLIYF